MKEKRLQNKEFIVQVKVASLMQERAMFLITHCIEAGVVTGNFIEGETAKVINSFEVVKGAK